MDVDWTADDARNAEAGLETDRRVLRVMGVEPKEQIFKGASLRSSKGVKALLGSQQVSRTAEGAHRAREWLRGQKYHGKQIRVDIFQQDTGAFMARAYYWMKGATPPSNVTIAKANAPNEHLATARLILVLAAEGVLD